MISLRGGQVLTEQGFRRGDVLVVDDTIAAVGDVSRDESGHVIDASGCLVGPGFVDLHTHLREPGQTWKEDIETGSAAAAAGGFTAVVAMPNTDPPVDQAKVVAEIRSRGEEVGLVEVAPAAAVTVGRAGLEVSDLETLYQAGVRIFTDDGDTVTDPDLMAGAMKRLCRLPGSVLAQHAEDDDLGEERIVARDLELAASIGARYHCQHVSAAGTVDLIRAAKRRGVAVTAEVTPHHLTFDETAVTGPRFKMYPPLRTSGDRAQLRMGLVDGTLDVVATDHAPHTEAEKAVGFEQAPRGVIGLETAAAAVRGLFGEPEALFRCLSQAPARIGALEQQGRLVAPGAPANLVVFDPEETWLVDGFRSRSANSPYLGMTLTGQVRATIYRGRVSHLAGGGR